MKARCICRFYIKIYLMVFFILLSGIKHFSYSQTVFAVIGDMGTNDGDELGVATLVDSWHPAFIFTVGDNVYTASYPDDVGKYYHKYMYPHEPSYSSDTITSNQFWPTVGNWDWSVNNLQDYINYFVLPTNGNNNERYYVKQIGDIEFFVIDSDPHEPDGSTSSATAAVNSIQGQWIHQQIINSTAKWKFVLFHHPAYSSDDGNTTYMQWPFEDWGVDAVINGHVHNYERILRDDNHDGNTLVYFVDGMGGKYDEGYDPTGTVSGSQVQYNSVPGALKVTESSDHSSLTFQFINSAGTLIDTYQLTKTTPTPVELTTFNATLIDNSTVQLNWSTATEVNDYGFDVERSIENTDWQKIGFVAGSGNSNSPKYYSFQDNPSGGYLFDYRLKQLDFDGSFKYYDPISVSLTGSNQPQLLQNSPNPFNPSTTIKFYTPSTEDVSIKIYDILGREVTTLINKQTTAGYHIVYWNGKNSKGEDVASGIYLYRLTTGSYSESKKMNLLK